MKKSSEDLVKTIQRILKDSNIQYSYDNRSGTFLFTRSLKKGTIRMVQYAIRIKGKSYSIRLISPVGLITRNSYNVLNVALFINSVNRELKQGHFEFDLESGKIQYRCLYTCNGTVPSAKALIRNIQYPAKMFERNSDKLTSIILGQRFIKEDATIDAEKEKNSVRKESCGFAFTNDVVLPF